jgi:hypothetical protein
MDDWQHDKKVTNVKARNDVVYYWVVPAPVAGVWVWSEKTAAGEATASLELRQYFQDLKGSFAPPNPRLKCRLTGTVAGRSLTVKARVPEKGRRTEVIFEGTVTGDSVVGTQTWKRREGPVLRPWRATRKPVALAGRWQVSTLSRKEKPDGILSLAVNPKALKASFIRVGQRAAREASALYHWGASVRFEIPWSEEDVAIFTGFFDGDEGRGTVFGGPFARRISWSAKRLSGH